MHYTTKLTSMQTVKIILLCFFHLKIISRYKVFKKSSVSQNHLPLLPAPPDMCSQLLHDDSTEKAEGGVGSRNLISVDKAKFYLKTMHWTYREDILNTVLLSQIDEL